MEKTVILQLKNITKKFGTKVIANNNVSLDVYKGEILSILGENGCGKSTLIKQIMNHNENIRLGSRVKIGYIEQDITFEDESLEVIEEARKFFIGSEENLRSALVRFLFYSEGIHTRLNKLSGGENTICSLIKLIFIEPDILFLDEI